MSMTGVSIEDGGLFTLVLAKPNVPTVGEGCERSVGWCERVGRTEEARAAYEVILVNW